MIFSGLNISNKMIAAWSAVTSYFLSSLGLIGLQCIPKSLRQKSADIFL